MSSKFICCRWVTVAPNKTKMEWNCKLIPNDYKVFSHDVTAAMLVSQNNEMAAMLVSQTNPLGVGLFSYVNNFFCSNKFA